MKEVYTDGVTTITKYIFAGGSYKVIEMITINATKKYYLIAGKHIVVEDNLSEECAITRYS